MFPVRLKAEDWNSGETYWLLDVIAPSQKVATAVLANFKQVVKDKSVRIHPIVSQLVDPAVLEKMKVRPVGEAEGKWGLDSASSNGDECDSPASGKGVSS